MIVALKCIIDDGARPVDPSQPLDRRLALAIQQSEDVTLRITLVNRGGDQVRLAGGEYLVFTARTVPSPQSRRLFKKNSTHTAGLAPNVYDVAILAADTKAITVTRAIYDLWCKRAAGNVVVIPTSELVINRSTADVSAL